jgi:hypothetical protein
MELTANILEKQYQFKEQQLRTAAFKIMGVLKALTNKLLNADRATFSAAPVTCAGGWLARRYVLSSILEFSELLVKRS